MLNSLASASLNRLLEENTWGLDRLKPFAGKTVRFNCPPFIVSLTVQEGGGVLPAFDNAVSDVTIVITPGLMLRLVARDETAWTEANITGDMEFAAVINYLVRNLRWDAEEDLSRLFGDIAAHRMTQSAKTLDQWRGQALDNLLRSFAEYWTDEQPLIAGARDVERFNRDVDALRDDVARFEKAVEPAMKRDAGTGCAASQRMARS